MGKARYGTMYTSEYDYYKFNATKSGIVKISFSLAEANKERKICTPIRVIALDNKGTRFGNDEICTTKTGSISIKVEKNKQYYLRISGGYKDSIDAVYKIRVACKK